MKKMMDLNFKITDLKETYAKNREEKQEGYSNNRRIAEAESQNHLRLFWGYKRRNLQRKKK